MSARSLLAVVTLLALIAGCTEQHRSANQVLPLELIHIKIREGRSGGIVDPTYMGSFYFPFCVNNPNPFKVRGNSGYEVYLEAGVKGSSRRIVENVSGAPMEYYDPQQSREYFAALHNVFANETASGGLNYTIHAWYMILNPDPIHYRERWFNLTFIPNGSNDIYEEGRADCQR